MLSISKTFMMCTAAKLSKNYGTPKENANISLNPYSQTLKIQTDFKVLFCAYVYDLCHVELPQIPAFIKEKYLPISQKL